MSALKPRESLLTINESDGDSESETVKDDPNENDNIEDLIIADQEVEE